MHTQNPNLNPRKGCATNASARQLNPATRKGHWTWPALALGAIVWIVSLPTSQGATKTWDGSASALWSNGANWSGSAAPLDGDTVVFPVTASNKTTTNNILNLSLDSLRFDGSNYTIYGSALRTDSILAAAQGGVNAMHVNLTIPSTTVNNIVVSRSASSLLLYGDIHLNGYGLYCSGAGAIHLSGPIDGMGVVVLNGVGTVYLGGASPNTYDGETLVNEGTLVLNKPAGVIAVPGPLSIGSGDGPDLVQLRNDDQIAATADVYVRNNGTLDLNDQTNTIGSLHLIDVAIVQTGTGLLRLGGDVTASNVDESPVIYGRLHLGNVTRTFDVAEGAMLSVHAEIAGGSMLMPGGGTRLAGLIKTGGGSLALAESNSYGGPTTVNDGTLHVALAGKLGNSLSGTTVNGNGVLSLGGITVNGESLVLNSTNATGAMRAQNTSRWNAPMTLRTNVTIRSYGGLYLNGPITGTGGITFKGNRVQLAGDTSNDYDGDTVVHCDLLELNHVYIDDAVANHAIPANLTIAAVEGGIEGSNTVRLLQSSQLRDTSNVQFLAPGLLDLDNHSTSVGRIEFAASSTIDLDLGTLRLRGNIVCSADSQISGDSPAALDLGSSTRTVDTSTGHLDILPKITGTGGLIKNGPRFLTLHGASTYSGLTTINDGMLVLRNPLALGSTAQGTRVNGGRLDVHGFQVPAESLVLNHGNNPLECDFATGSWGGPVTLNSDVILTGVQLTFGNSIAGSYGLTFQTSSITYTGDNTNTYTGLTWLKSGKLTLNKLPMNGAAIPANLVIGDPLDDSTPATVELGNSVQIGKEADVTLHRGGRLNLNRLWEYLNRLEGSGEVDLTGGKLVVGWLDGSSTFSGSLKGTNGVFDKRGLGTVILRGTNTFTGTNNLFFGSLLVYGVQPNSAVVVHEADPPATLGGAGTVGNVYMLGGRLAPGTSAGKLTCSNLLMEAAATLAMELNGPMSGEGAACDQVDVRGSVMLNSPALQVSLGFAPVDGQPFTLINNDAGDAVAGTFAGYPDGALVPAGPLQCRISYGTPPSANDVKLTFTNTVFQLAGAEFRAGNGNPTLDTNECAYLWITLSNTTAIPMEGIAARLQTMTPDLAVTYGASAYPSVAPGVAVANTEPFQVATQPGFVCGRTARFMVDIQSASHGAFSFPISVPTGSAGAGVPYTWSGAIDTINRQSVTSSIPVSGFSEPVAKVTVSVHLTHSYVGDIGLALIAPNGGTVVLSSGNGGAGDDYGSDCLSSRNQTVFDDDALRPITAGAPPFAGRFRPEEELSRLRGVTGNGTWKLVIPDSAVHLDTGTLLCWTLTLHPLTCADGGGVCEICPDRVISGMLSGASPQQNGHMPLGFGGECGAEVPFTFVIPAPVNYHAYTFVQTETNACVSASLQSSLPMACVVYTNGFDPAQPLVHNFANLAGTTREDQPRDMFFRAQTGVVYTVVVHTTNLLSPVFASHYTLTLSGGNCRPVLNATPTAANRVVLDWTTSAAGYWLERTNRLANPPQPPWQLVPDLAIVVNSRFTVTNSMAGDTNRFYRLHKP